MKALNSVQIKSLSLKNRIAMAPMTRSRADQDHVPTDIMATYYGQRSGAGLIITEGTSPSPNGVGYPRIPGIYNQAQIDAWKPVTQAVHERGSKVFLQVMHTGRISHPLNLPEGARVLAPSAIAAANTEMYTDQEGNQALPVPAEMTQTELQEAISEYVQAAKNAVEAGFDGVELHSANGYLLEQFISPDTNQRSDHYGGSIENRARFVLEVARETIKAIGADKVGIRLSPYGVFNDLGIYDALDETYAYLASELDKLGLVYVHLVDHSAMGAPEVPERIKETIRKAFTGTLILSGGYDLDRAEADIQAGKADLVAIGRPFIANPDLLERYQEGAELAQPDFDTFYTPGEKGYTDYPVLIKA